MHWHLKTKAPSAFFKQFPEFSPLIIQLLYNRGLKTQEQIDEFFNPDFQADLHNPFLMKGMKQAVKRIFQAIKKKEKITIYGDFDADGVCATAILFLTLKDLGHRNIAVYIPDRVKEGHGLNRPAIKQLAQKGTGLIITVDCGSTDLTEVKLANSLGLDMIITDHHQVGDKLPRAKAMINPWQKKDKYPFKQLAGAGVAYKLACALFEESSSSNSLEKWLLDLVALATVADVMSIIGENRTLVKYGLTVLAQTQWLGLKKIIEIAQVNSFDTNTLGYALGPRLNAAGRLDHANTAFQLLITQDKQEAAKLAQQLNQGNIARQNLTDKIVQEVKDRLANLEPEKIPKLIFEGSPDWPVGIIGLVAGKITEKYCRPVIIYQEKEEMIFASCRSIPRFDLVEMIKQAADYLDDFGGHKGAAGFRMNKENLDKVRNIFSQLAETKLKDKDLVAYLEIDAALSLDDITWQNYDQIQSFAPFGRFNPEPRFLIKGAQIADLRIVGNNGKHLKLDLRIVDHQLKLAKNFKAIGFGLADWQTKLKLGQPIDLVFELIVDQWNGQRDLQMKIIDIEEKNMSF